MSLLLPLLASTTQRFQNGCLLYVPGSHSSCVPVDAAVCPWMQFVDDKTESHRGEAAGSLVVGP